MTAARTIPCPRVLVAEDDPDMQTLLVLHLRREGYEVVGVRDGRELAAAVASALLPGATRPDFVVSDVRMPGIDGLSVLGSIRAAGWDVPVILVSGFADKSVREQARRLGRAVVLDKPFEVEQLTGALRAFDRGPRPV